MELAEAALSNLVHVARLDGRVCRDESDLIARYGAALDLSPGAIGRLKRVRQPELVSPSELTGTRDERRHVLKMMVRVACADGRMTRPERRALRRVAKTLSIGRFEFADLAIHVHRQAGLRHGVRLWQFVTVASVGLASFLAWLWISRLSNDADDAREAVCGGHSAARRAARGDGRRQSGTCRGGGGAGA